MNIAALEVNELFIYPHSADFLTKPLHGELYFKNETSCQKCHDFPHTDANWKKGEMHGVAFIRSWEKDKTSIADTSEKQKRVSKADCLTCHTNKDSIPENQKTSYQSRLQKMP